MKAYLYYFLEKGFSDEDVKKMQKEMPRFGIERTSKDELVVKVDTSFEELYEKAYVITEAVQDKLGLEVQHNRTITFRDQ
jgi:hypothetical protein